MKLILSAVFAVIFLTAPALSFAQTLMFGYEARVSYTNGSSTHIFEFLLSECDKKFNQAFGNGSGVDFVNSYYCRPRFKDLPILVEKFDWNLGCIVCGVMTDDTVRLVFPEHVEAVMRLKDEFGIDGYIAELEALQRGYDLDGFHQRMSELEQSTLR